MTVLVLFMLQLTLTVICFAVICLVLGMLDSMMFDGAVLDMITDKLKGL